MRELPPFLYRKKYYSAIEAEIDRIFRALIYAPLQRVLDSPQPEYLNAPESRLVQAIRDGDVWYYAGRFHGTFNAAISKKLRSIGATFDGRSKTWVIERGNIPADILIAMQNADSRYEAMRQKVLDTLESISFDSINNLRETTEKYRQTIGWMDGDWAKTVRGVLIPPKLTPEGAENLARAYAQNLDLYIKKWAKKNILELREKVQQHAFAGNRAESLAVMIRQNYGVSTRKARFLARQETSLLMSTFREERYKSVGVQKYKWSTSHDERVRADHKRLNGMVCLFSSPPVTNRATGERANPGVPFGCRCIAIGLVE